MNPISPGARRRAFDLLSLALLVLMHLSVLLVFVVHFSWPMVLLAVGSYTLRMWGITAGYHRYFAHRTFKTSRAFQLVLAVVGTSAMQNGPLWWASHHRHHHKHSDLPGDRHSPLYGGFWHSHMTWIFGPNRDPDFSNIPDLTKYPELRFLNAHEWIPIVGFAVLCKLVGGWPGVVWGFSVATIAVFHATMLINSLAHVWGTRRYATKDTSRNNALLALLTMGEGWHNNHHHYMSSARQGFYWWEVDVSYYTLRALALVGIVWDVREPSPACFEPAREPVLAPGLLEVTAAVPSTPRSADVLVPEAAAGLICGHSRSEFQRRHREHIEGARARIRGSQALLEGLRASSTRGLRPALA